MENRINPILTRFLQRSLDLERIEEEFKSNSSSKIRRRIIKAIIQEIVLDI